MTEVLSRNFDELYPRVERAVRAAKFVAVDMEFTALYLDDDDKDSLFDTAEIRYAKKRATVSRSKPIQVGLSAFAFDPDEAAYKAETYTFYIWPKPLLGINHNLTFSASSFQFLCNHKFDFNKLIYDGVSFLDRSQAELLHSQLSREDNLQFTDSDFENRLELCIREISSWYYTSKMGDVYPLKGFCNNDVGFLYYANKHIRSRFQGGLWTEVIGGELVARRVAPEEYHALSKEHDLETETMQAALGFSRVYRLLLECKKPLVGHNLFMDLMLLMNTFEAPLPVSYQKFKKVVLEQFPTIFDTKVISFRAGRLLPKNKVWSRNTLGDLYEFYKGCKIGPEVLKVNGEEGSSETYHDAGWDSFCTGYIFVKMAQQIITGPLKPNAGPKAIMSVQHFAAVEEHKNVLNLIRCTQSAIHLDKDDPKSTRPSYLVATSKKGHLNVSQLSSLLSNAGRVEIKLVNDEKAIIAVDNHTSYKHILNRYGRHEDFYIRRYSAIKEPIIWCAAILSTGFIAYLIYKMKAPPNLFKMY